MIGQKDLLDRIVARLKAGNYSPILLVGDKMELVVNELAHIFHTPTYTPESNIDAIREAIWNMQETQFTHLEFPRIVFLKNLDLMSRKVQMALLKTVEEPPENNLIIATAFNTMSVIEPLKSRFYIQFADRWLRSELEQWLHSILDEDGEDNPYSDEVMSFIFSICFCPTEIEQVLAYDADRFYDYVHKLVAHIDTSSLANAMKTIERIDLKPLETRAARAFEKDKYDPSLLIKAFAIICTNLAKDMKKDPKDYDGNMLRMKYLMWASYSASACYGFTLPNANVKALYDTWLNHIRDSAPFL